MTRFKTGLLLFLTLLFFNISQAQEQKLPDEPNTSIDKATLYIRHVIMTAANLMPEKYYSFRPTPDVRTFGELMAHIAESNFEMTAIAKGDTSPVFKVAPTKPEVINGLAKSFDYFTQTQKEMTKERKETLVKFMDGTEKAGNVLDFSLFHSLQHYGSVIVYLRLKGFIPPSSQ